MSNKDIIKQYEQVCAQLKRDTSEESKQQYLIIFKELELQLNRSFYEKVDQLSYTAKNLREEIKRIDALLALIENRAGFRTRMIADHHKFIGYDPLELETIEEIERYEDYKTYKNNLISANEMILELIRSGKKIKTLKNQLARNPRNKDYIASEINKYQSYRTNVIENLKSNADVLDDLYNYCLTAPFNEENAYIEYIMIKLNPKSELKINLTKENKRSVKSRTKPNDAVIKNEMPTITSIGAVKPATAIEKMTSAASSFEDIDIPTNGLVDTKKEVQIDLSNL